MYVWRQFAAQSVHSGRMPLWNPLSGCGAPFLANDQSAVMNPANLLLNAVFSPARAQTVLMLLCLLASCLFTYGLVRALGGEPLGGMVAGLVYGFGGFIITWLGHPHVATAAWLPALLWATHWAGRKPGVVRMTVVALIIGEQFLSGHLSTSVQMLAFWLVFVGYEITIVRRTRPCGWTRPFAGLMAVALVLGSGLAAPQLLPTREYFGQSGISEKGRSRFLSNQSCREPVERLAGRLVVPAAFRRRRTDAPLLSGPAGQPGRGRLPSASGLRELLRTNQLRRRGGAVPAPLRTPLAGPPRARALLPGLRLGDLRGADAPACAERRHLPAGPEVHRPGPPPVRLHLVRGLRGRAELERTTGRPAEMAVRPARPLLGGRRAPGSGLAGAGPFDIPLAYPEMGRLRSGVSRLPHRQVCTPVLAAAALAGLLAFTSRRPERARLLGPGILAIVIADLFVYGACWHPFQRPDGIFRTCP